MEVGKCVNTDCDRHGVELELPAVVQVAPGVGFIGEYVCMSCHCALWKCEPRPVHLLLTMAQAEDVVSILGSAVPTDPFLKERIDDLVERVRHAVGHLG